MIKKKIKKLLILNQIKKMKNTKNYWFFSFKKNKINIKIYLITLLINCKNKKCIYFEKNILIL